MDQMKDDDFIDLMDDKDPEIQEQQENSDEEDDWQIMESENPI